MILKVPYSRTEEEIIKDWKYTEPPLVSIRCTTYNHEPYIRDAMKGFLMQETDFPFEIIIHDDASTDGTADIIREYETRYPRLIKPIYQIENQYSKGSSRVSRIINKRVRGNFVALCEGDDFWTDPLKLQAQIDEMKKHPECDISFHPATVAYQDRSRPDRLLGKHRAQTSVIPLSEVIRGGGDFIPTASIVIAKDAIETLPEWYYTIAPIGDLYLQIWGSRNGGALFIDRNMAVYRAMVSGSWSQRMHETDYIKINCREKIIECHVFLKQDLGKEYNRDVDYFVSREKRKISIFYLRKKDFKNFRKFIEESWVACPKTSFGHSLLYFLRKFPQVILFLDKTRSLLNRIC